MEYTTEKLPISEDDLKDIIDSHDVATQTTDMRTAQRYYGGYHDEIESKKFNEYDIEGESLVDENKANNHMANDFFGFGVDQKTGYISGDPVVITHKKKDDTAVADLQEVLGPHFQKILQEHITDVSVNGKSYIHPYIGRGRSFKYRAEQGDQIIAIKDTATQEVIEMYVRYYPLVETSVEGTTIYRNRVEVWDSDKVTLYQENEDGDYTFIVPGFYGDVTENPMYHFATWYTNGIGERKNIEGHSWGEPPIIETLNNFREKSDLARIKKYVDAIDLVTSGYLNNLEDVQLVLWVLKGYEGTNLREFMMNLIKYKAMNVSEDGGVEAKTVEIPFEATTAMIEWCTTQIYKLGAIVDMDKVTGGSVTNVMIQAMYTNLDTKAKQLIVHLKDTLSELTRFACLYLEQFQGKKYDYTEFEFHFNLKQIFNQLEAVQMARDSQGIISKETIVKNHPWVSDPKAEMEALEKELGDNLDEDIDGITED